MSPQARDLLDCGIAGAAYRQVQILQRGTIMNPYLKNLRKAEYIITYACTGACRHCSQGNIVRDSACIDASRAAAALDKIAASCSLQTVMCFGGEPLLYPDGVYTIIGRAKTLKIPHRQVITNGCFTRDKAEAARVVRRLFDCGVNDLRVSADAFHQRTIPVEYPLEFAIAAARAGIPVQAQPAWVQSRDSDNQYDRETRRIMDIFAMSGIAENPGNIIFPEGRARETLREFFAQNAPQNPYEDDPYDVRCLSFEPSGKVLDGNFYNTDIMDILTRYRPFDTDAQR